VPHNNKIQPELLILASFIVGCVLGFCRKVGWCSLYPQSG